RGDGVEGRIVSSRAGELGRWTVQHGQEQTGVARVTVQPGDTIDFVVDCRAGVDSDTFGWAPTIRETGISGAPAAGLTTVWSAREDFSGPQEQPEPLTAWERYAQVLLMSNELVFVD
ncbi:MAG: hypothetical protein KGS61_18270, partial [Verrucomicrobia bacterium]|nr:hypothetical protein [Verrucomicrobiota bacterium]